MTDTGTGSSRDVALRATAFDALPGQAAVLDTDGTILATNDGWTDFAASNGIVDRPEMVGENYLAACDAADDDYASEVAAGLRAVIEGREAEFAFEYPCHGPDERRWFMMRALPMEHRNEEFLLVTHTNITQRREAELAVAERNESLELLTGILSHDVRNPLGVALGRAEMLEGDEHVEAIRSSLERMNDIIADALMLARGTEIGDTAVVDLESVASDAWSHVETASATLTVTGTLRFRADATTLGQVFENLFRNAIEHAGPAATVRVGPLTDERSGFFVADDGPGVPAEERDSVFEPGFTTKRDRGGTGLGLAIVRRIATAHGWEVVVTEGTDGGARFEFTDVTSVN